jgi:hypothetical protein
VILRTAVVATCACACGRLAFEPHAGDAREPDALDQVQPLQQASAYGPAPSQSLSATFPGTPEAGDVLVLVGATPLGSLASATGAAASWNRITRSTDNANIEVWVGVADGSGDTVTIARPGGTGEMAMAISAWRGVLASPAYDVAAARSGLASPATAGGLTTTGGSRLLLFAVGSFLPNTFGVPVPDAWTALGGAEGGTIQHRTWYRIEAQGGTFAPTVTETDHRWDAALVALLLPAAP